MHTSYCRYKINFEVILTLVPRGGSSGRFHPQSGETTEYVGHFPIKMKLDTAPINEDMNGVEVELQCFYCTTAFGAGGGKTSVG
jgi:hypothetical protein